MSGFQCGCHHAHGWNEEYHCIDEEARNQEDLRCHQHWSWRLGGPSPVLFQGTSEATVAFVKLVFVKLRPHLGPLDQVLMMTAMRSIFADKNNQEGLFLNSGGPGSDLEFCIVRPGGLKDEPATNDVKIIKGEAGGIPRADVAAFCLDAIMDPEFEYIGQTPCLSTGEGGTSWTKKDTGGNTARQALNQSA
eukprot:scaffold602_cov298-Pinguiococcus_pyrenoidosus.AAC.22